MLAMRSDFVAAPAACVRDHGPCAADLANEVRMMDALPHHLLTTWDHEIRKQVIVRPEQYRLAADEQCGTNCLRKIGAVGAIDGRIRRSRSDVTFRAAGRICVVQWHYPGGYLFVRLRELAVHAGLWICRLRCIGRPDD